MTYEPCEPPVKWPRPKKTFETLVNYIESEVKEERDRLPIIDYWIGELFRFRSYLQGK